MTDGRGRDTRQAGESLQGEQKQRNEIEIKTASMFYFVKVLIRHS